ncbi:MAG: hypothetical protein WDM87_07055 [Terracidiphilus sp.]
MDARIVDAANHVPPAFALAVDDAFAGDGHVLGVGGAHEGLQSRKTELYLCG